MTFTFHETSVLAPQSLGSSGWTMQNCDSGLIEMQEIVVAGIALNFNGFLTVSWFVGARNTQVGRLSHSRPMTSKPSIPFSRAIV